MYNFVQLFYNYQCKSHSQDYDNDFIAFLFIKLRLCLRIMQHYYLPLTFSLTIT